MSRKNDDSLGCLFALLFFPLAAIYCLIRDGINAISRSSSRRKNIKSSPNRKDKNSYKKMDDLDFDEMNDVWDDMGKDDY